jgi:hypothetical protein
LFLLFSMNSKLLFDWVDLIHFYFLNLLCVLILF